MSWRTIDSAPRCETVIVGDEHVQNVAVAHMDGVWCLGAADAEWAEELDFTPAWWLPRNYPTNPFKAALPVEELTATRKSEGGTASGSRQGNSTEQSHNRSSLTGTTAVSK